MVTLAWAQVAGLGGIDRPAVQALVSMGDWNQARDRPLGAYTDTDGQCTHTVATGVYADGPARLLHMGMRSGGLGQVKHRMEVPTKCPTGRVEWLVYIYIYCV